MGSLFSKSVYRSTPPITYSNDEPIRIVMVGKTGVGKSATGNTILQKELFESDFSPTSLSEHCKKAFGTVAGQKVAVIDTPGLFDTGNTEEKTVKYIAQCITFASPGPHIFLVVIKLDRFTEEEKKTVQKIQEIFGEEADKYSMVLFTHGDLLKGISIEEFLKDSKDLQELVAKCNGQYHVFNNEEEDRSQVSELLEKIRKINEQNGGSYYTTEMFQKAERAIEEEKQRILKEREEQNRKELEELKKEIEEKYEQQMRVDRERENELMVARKREMEEEVEKLKENCKELEDMRKKIEKKYEQQRKEERPEREKENALREEVCKIKEELEKLKEKSKEQEELRKETEEEYERQMRKEEADRKRENELRDARAREMEEEMKKLRKTQETQARQEAEENGTIRQKILRIVMQVLLHVVTELVEKLIKKS